MQRTAASRCRPALAGVLLASAALPAQADPGYYVVTPYDNAGKVILDFRYWTVKARREPEEVWPEFGIGYGVTSRWTTELFWSGIGPSSLRVRRSSVNWQNQFLLTQGEWPVDVALHLQLIRDRDGRHSVEFGPLLQTDVGRTQLNLNLIWDIPWRRDQPAATALKLQWQVRHRAWPGVHVGAMGFAELGPWRDALSADRPSHRAGPALFLTHPDGPRTWKLQAGWLWGKTYGDPGHMATVRAHMEY